MAVRIHNSNKPATSRPRSESMYLIKQALSRARMRSPHGEAPRAARRIAMKARRRQARDLGDLFHIR